MHSVEKLKTISKNDRIPDNQIIKEALTGSKQALEKLILRYQDWIFNLAIRMVNSPDDAKDVTQEIIIKIITHLKKYDEQKASFKTWLYRIVINHILNMKKRGLENTALNFDNYYERLDYIKDKEPDDKPEIQALIFDTMTNCIMATLICLNRQQRIVIILGVIFGINSKIGAELLNISSVNFRKILSRSRAKLKNFMGTTCSLVNKKAKCKCHLKITDLINLGYRNPGNLIYDKLKYNNLVKNIAVKRVEKFMNRYFYRFNDLFQSQPFWQAPNMLKWLDQTIKNRDFIEIFNLEDNQNLII